MYSHWLKKKWASGKVFDLQFPGSSPNMLASWWLLQEPLWNELVIIVQFLLTGIHLTTSAAGSHGSGYGREVQSWKNRKDKQCSHNRMWLPSLHDSYPGQYPLDHAAQRPGPWPTGFSLRSRRLSDITAIYKETAFGLVLQELLLLALPWDESFCLSKGSQRVFVVLPALPGILM